MSDAEQETRFRSTLDDRMRQWRLWPMNLDSITRWLRTRAPNEMLVHTDMSDSPWYVIAADDKRAARINMIHHLLSAVPYYAAQRPPLDLPLGLPAPATNGRQESSTRTCRTPPAR